MPKEAIRLAESAIHDLEELRRWYARQGVPETGDRTLRRILDSIRPVGRTARDGARRPRVRAGFAARVDPATLPDRLPPRAGRCVRRAGLAERAYSRGTQRRVEQLTPKSTVSGHCPFEVPKKEKRKTGRDRRLRLRLFRAGNTKCPICLSDFTESDVVTGKMTLEHVPPERLRGSPICLTCSPCNNGTSRIDKHAILARRARDEWSSGQGRRVEVDFFGIKKSLRFNPNDAHTPLPTRVSQLRNGSIRLGRLPSGETLDPSKGVRFRMLGSPHYESVGMVKAAYLMVLSLMGPAGYKFGCERSSRSGSGANHESCGKNTKGLLRLRGHHTGDREDE